MSMLDGMQTCEDGPVALLHAWPIQFFACTQVCRLCLPAGELAGSHHRETRCFLNFCGRLARPWNPIVSFASIETPALFCPRPCSRSSQNMGSLVVALSASGHIGLVSLAITRTSCDTLMRAKCSFFDFSLFLRCAIHRSHCIALHFVTSQSH